MDQNARRKLRMACRHAYDVQGARITLENRTKPKGGAAPPIDLDEEDRKFMAKHTAKFYEIEEDAMADMVRIASKNFPRIFQWLRGISGIGPIGASLCISEFDIVREERPSQMWSFCGLGIDETTGRAPKPKKGEKLPFNKWLRTKILFVVGGCLLKAENERYALGYYAQYMHRKRTELGPCQLCKGTGIAIMPKNDKVGHVQEGAGKPVTCWNCVGNKEDATTLAANERKSLEYEMNLQKFNDGTFLDKRGRKKGKPHPFEPKPLPFNMKRFTPDNAPWGEGAKHRHNAALRYAVKIFLLDFWKQWRELEGLPVVPSYHEAKQQGHIDTLPPASRPGFESPAGDEVDIDEDDELAA